MTVLLFHSYRSSHLGVFGSRYLKTHMEWLPVASLFCWVLWRLVSSFERVNSATFPFINHFKINFLKISLKNYNLIRNDWTLNLIIIHLFTGDSFCYMFVLQCQFFNQFFEVSAWNWRWQPSVYCLCHKDQWWWS